MKKNILFTLFFDENIIDDFLLLHKSISNIYKNDKYKIFCGVSENTLKDERIIEFQKKNKRVIFRSIENFLLSINDQSLPKHISIYTFAKIKIKLILEANSINYKNKTIVYLDCDILCLNKIPQRYLSSNYNFMFNNKANYSHHNGISKVDREEEIFSKIKSWDFWNASFDLYKKSKLIKNEFINNKVDDFLARHLYSKIHVNGGVIIINNLRTFSCISETIDKLDNSLYSIFNDQFLLNIFAQDSIVFANDINMNHGILTNLSDSDIIRELDSIPKTEIIFLHFKG